MRSQRFLHLVAFLAVLVAPVVLPADAAGQAEDKTVPETYTARTANMEPDGEEIKFSVLRWSSDGERQATASVLSDIRDAAQVAAVEGADQSAEALDEALARLQELPSVGYLWPGSSSVGYALKYAHRLAGASGGERIAFVTDRPLGAFGRAPWAAAGVEPPEAGYAVIELRLDTEGQGEGKMSLAAEVTLDAATGSIALGGYEGAPTLLQDVTHEPPPYWARD